MKIKKNNPLISLVTICLVLFSVKSYAQVDSINHIPCPINKKQMIDHITKALLDPDIMIGVFEKYNFNHKLKHLKSGDIPEMDKNYLHDMISFNLTKLGTQTAIKGDFDSLIFIKFPVYAISDGNNSFKSNPEFHMGSAWILLLERAFNNDGSPKMEWAGKLKSENRKLFNETTVFLEAFETYYALCYKWPTDKSKSSDIIMTDEGMVEDLIAISKILELKNKDKKIESFKSMLEKNAFSSECSRKIVEKILPSLSNK